MKDREKKFILKFATEREENDLRITNGKKYDLTPDILDFIEQTISERDKELIETVKNMGRLGLNEREKDWNAMLSWVVGELKNELQTLTK